MFRGGWGGKGDTAFVGWFGGCLFPKGVLPAFWSRPSSFLLLPPRLSPPYSCGREGPLFRKNSANQTRRPNKKGGLVWLAVGKEGCT